MKLSRWDILKIVISFGLVAYLLWRVKPATLIEATRGANYLLLFTALVLYFGALLLNVWKWSVLLAAQGEKVSYKELLSFSFVGLFLGNFLPTNIGGDVVRGYDLARHLRRAEDAAVSVVVDRLIGLLAFITSAAGMSLIALYVWKRQEFAPLTITACLVCLVAVGGIVVMLSRRLRTLVGKLFRWRLLAKLAPIYERLSGALQDYREHPKALLSAYGIGLTVLVTSNLVNYLISVAIHADIPLAYIFLFNPMVAFAPLLVPSVGGLGVNQGAYDLLYASIGGVTTRQAALAVSLLMQLTIYISSLPGGLFWLKRRQVDRTSETN